MANLHEESHQNETGDGDMSRQLPEALLYAHLEDILDDVLAGNATATDSAAKAASMVISQEDVSRAFDNFLAPYFKAIESMANEPSLTLLVDYIVALASLPDAYNEGPEPKKISIGGDEIKIINPGPELWLYSIGSPSSPETAMAHWRNFNTYLALLQKNRKAQDIPVLSGTVRLALRALPMALEHSPETRLGKNAELHAPAAAQWLRLAGNEIEELCAERNERMVAGDLWVAKGGSDVCDLARLQFWKERLPQVLLDGDSV